jgi:hypothetical protein
MRDERRNLSLDTPNCLRRKSLYVSLGPRKELAILCCKKHIFVNIFVENFLKLICFISHYGSDVDSKIILSDNKTNNKLFKYNS